MKAWLGLEEKEQSYMDLGRGHAQEVQTCVEPSASGAPDNSSLSHPSRARRAPRPHRHARARVEVGDDCTNAP